MTWARSSPFAGVVHEDNGMPAPSVRLWMRIPLPFRPYATPSPPPLPGGKRSIHGAVLPLNHPTFLSKPEEACLHGSQRPVGLPALQPPMCGTLRRPLGAAGKITPAAASNQDVEQR